MIYLVYWTTFLLLLSLIVNLYILRHDIFDWAATLLIERSLKTPYFHLQGYMERYWLVPYCKEGSETDIGCYEVSFFKRPIAFLLQKLGIAVRVHKILRSDAGRDFHNHPWNFVSIVLENKYIEVTPAYDSNGFYMGEVRTYRTKGSFAYRKSGFFHRIECFKYGPNNPYEIPVWTLFISGPEIRTWAFMTNPSNIVPFYEYFKTFKK
jgi:hypothetical protein